jgi:N-6 DNA Methylase
VEGALIAPAMLARIAEQKAAAQADADYSIPKGLTLRDEIARYFRIGQALFKELFVSATPSATATTRFIESLLRDVFGFSDISRAGAHMLGERLYPVTLEAHGGLMSVVVVPPSDDLDAPSVHLPSEGRRRSAASVLQDWLNAGRGALWGLCSNGVQLRLLRASASLTRPAFIEVDLRRIFEGEAFADFAALWLLIHASRFGAAGTVPTDCALERWREAGGKEGVVARKRLGEGVEASLLSLGGGFLAHPENAALRERLASGALLLPEYFGQLLRLVYRLIFLFAAEDKGLLHSPSASAAARRLYAEGCSVGALRDRAVRRAAWDRHHDRWEGLLIAFAALGSGERRLGLPPLGGLFEPGTIQDLEAARLANRDLMEAIYRLAWLREDYGPVPVNWRDMETEELGSVYEGLLELTPQLTENGRGFTFAEGGEGQGHARKTTGSYYTPDSLVQALLDSALDPVLDRVEAEAADPAAALLSVTVVDPACGSGHFLLAAARRIATRVARHRAEGVASAEDYRHALRDVVRSCIRGVDRNPLASELTKVALWIETVDPGKPLGFLDANIRCGDSLLGVFDLAALRHGILDAAYRPLTGDDRETARYFQRRNRDERAGQGDFDFTKGGGWLPMAKPLAATARALRAMPEDSLEDIAAKRRRFATGRADTGLWALQIAADLYTAAFLVSKKGGVPVNRNTVTIPTTMHVWEALAGRSVYGPLVGRAQDLAGAAHAFHWPLEFPDVMASGGFDVVLGNPPWERIKLQEQEFFAAREPEIANAPNAAARGKLIARLKDAEPGSHDRALYEEFEAAKRIAEASSVFARVPEEDRGRFPLTGRGDVNTYALFAELFATLAGPRGRAGVIVPTGIAHADTNKHFFNAIVQSNRLISLFGFYEVRYWFLETDDKNSFCLLTMGQSEADPLFIFDARPIQDLSDDRRRFTLSSADIARINPNTKTAPVFRSRADAELAAKIYARVPVLIDETKGAVGNPWGVSFMRMFDMSNDSGLFRTAAQLRESGFVLEGGDWIGKERYMPLYEAKMIHQFDHRWATYDGTSNRDVTAAEKTDPGFEPTPRYWVPEREIRDRLAAKGWTRSWLIGWRDITRNSDVRTVIADAFPARRCGK